MFNDTPSTKTKSAIGCQANGRMEGNVLFNDALNTFYLRLYGITHIIKNDSDKREET